jgi:L-ascorbate metabolism protein UlaG (beta-lactamase superfamily)
LIVAGRGTIPILQKEVDVRDCELTWFGQTGFMLVSGDTKILIDPFFSDHEARLYPGPSVDVCGKNVTALLITHEHLDHFDKELLDKLIDEYPEMLVAVPTPIVAELGSAVAAERLVGIQPGDSVRFGSVGIDVVPAYHALSVGDSFSDGRGDDGFVRFVGYVLRTPHLSVYHAGDTVATPDLVDALRPKAIDIALLPINGRDYFREQAGIVGNLTAREAVRLAVELGVSILVPTHWDLFADNTEVPGRVVDEAEALASGRLHVVVLARCVPLAFG